MLYRLSEEHTEQLEIKKYTTIDYLEQETKLLENDKR